MRKQFTCVKFSNLISLGVFMFVLGFVLNLQNSLANASGCGTINFPKGLSIEANQTQKGFWPFTVAIYEVKEYRLFCGGTLISKKHVLTAARCIQEKNTGLKYVPSEIGVVLGAYVLLAKSKGGMKHVNITEIRVHPDWEELATSRLDAGVAILVLSEIVTLTNDIQVTCLPSDDDVIEDATGFLVGWDLVQQTPKHSVINVLNNSYCYTENLFPNYLLSPRTFCGVGEVSVMKKISGGGFFTLTGSAWVQQGIAVSVTNATGDATNQTIVALMNVKSFKSWIAETVRHSGGVIGEAIRGKISMDCNFINLYYSYACVAHGLNLLSNNFVIDRLIGSHKSGENNSNVELMQFHNETMFYLANGIGDFFPNLKSIFVGYSDSLSLNTKLISRSNFQNMKNLFEIVIHKSDIETIAEDILWDLPNLERFQLDGRLKELPERTFENNANLKEVYLASNALEFLPRKLFKNNPSLDWVNFRNNFLKIIEIDFMRLTTMKYAFLAGNVCIDRDFNKTDLQVDYQYEDLNEPTDFYQFRRITELQRLIYSNCSV